MKVLIDLDDMEDVMDFAFYGRHDNLLSFVKNIEEREDWINSVPANVGDKESIKELVRQDKSLEDEFYRIIKNKVAERMIMLGEIEKEDIETLSWIEKVMISKKLIFEMKEQGTWTDSETQKEWAKAVDIAEKVK